MDCVIPSHSVRPFCTAIACLSRIGKDMYLEFDPLEGLTLRTLNDAKSAYSSIVWEPSFFEKCSAPPTSRKRRQDDEQDDDDEIAIRVASRFVPWPPSSSLVATCNLSESIRKFLTTCISSRLNFKFAKRACSTSCIAFQWRKMPIALWPPCPRREQVKLLHLLESCSKCSNHCTKRVPKWHSSLTMSIKYVSVYDSCIVDIMHSWLTPFFLVRLSRPLRFNMAMPMPFPMPS